MTTNTQTQNKLKVTLDDEQKEQILSKIDAIVNSKLEALEARINKIENTAESAMSAYKHLNKVSDHAMGNCASKDNEIQAIKADLIELSQNFGKIRDMLSTGKGTQKNFSRISADEYKQFAPVRLQVASLREVIDYINNGG